MALPRDISCETIMESVADGVFTVDLDWRITSFNRAAAEITGVPPHEALGRRCRDVFHSSICDGACVLRACIEQDTQLGNRSVFILRPDGRKVPVSISGAPLRDRRGRLIGGVETFRDLSALHLMRKQLDGQHTVEDIVTRSAAMIRLLGILPQVAASDAPVLVLGESGTGKELFARAIHNLSPRRGRPFVGVNCGALPEHLLESELFGYKAGAFTDARRDKPGRFALADDGTIFLDEIGDMPLPLQVKLLRVLQEKVYEPLGGVRPQAAPARVIAATNRDLERMAGEGGFRSDLFYRLNVVMVRLPALRERPEDIPLLLDHFVAQRNLLSGKEIEGVSEDVLHLLLRYPFPGNVREMENIVEYAFILCPRGFIQLEHLPEYLLGAQTPPVCLPVGLPGGTGWTAGPGGPMHAVAAGAGWTTPAQAVPARPTPAGPRTMAAAKLDAAREALRRHGGRVMAACRELDISKDTLRRILKGGGAD